MQAKKEKKEKEELIEMMGIKVPDREDMLEFTRSKSSIEEEHGRDKDKIKKL